MRKLVNFLNCVKENNFKCFECGDDFICNEDQFCCEKCNIHGDSNSFSVYLLTDDDCKEFWFESYQVYFKNKKGKITLYKDNVLNINFKENLFDTIIKLIDNQEFL